MRSYFPRLFGNDDSKVRVGRAIENRTAPHAFLLGGPHGTGKSIFALEIAAALNCHEIDNKEVSLPCGRCEACKRIYDGNFPDVKYLSKPKDKATLGVDAVKDFREDMFLSSTESEHKIYVIDDAESMTNESQNALLKVLEEPPQSVIIILLAKECDRILTTIKSRVQYIPLSRFSDGELSRILLENNPSARSAKLESEERFLSIIVSSDGRLGVAEELLSKKNNESNEEDRQDIINVLKALGSRASYADIYTALDSLPSKRGELSDALERLTTALRDLIVIKNGTKAKMLFFTSADSAREVLGETSLKRLLSAFDAINDAHEKCSRNANTQNLLINLSAKLVKQ